jgi:hypothetical protein
VRVIAPAWPPAPQSAITAGGNPASGRLVVSAMETSPRRRQTAAVGLASAILAGFVAYGMLFILELFLAGHSSPEILPPPGDWRMRLAVLVIAVIFGVLIALQWRRNRHRSGSAALSAFTVAAVLAAVVSTIASHVALERSYLHSVPAGTASDSALLDAGHKACNWLDARPWGRPPGADRGPNRVHYLEGVTYIGHPTSMIVKSTARLATYYHNYLATQRPSAMTRLEDEVSLLAWYKMCPFQQWVHRPIGGGSGD